MAQMNGMEKRNFTNSARNGGKMAKMQNNNAKSGMVGMSGKVMSKGRVLKMIGAAAAKLREPKQNKM